jgi:hypothetical protein
MAEEGGGHCIFFMVTKTQTTPPHHRYADMRIWTLRRLPVALMADSAVSLAARTTGAFTMGAPQ